MGWGSNRLTVCLLEQGAGHRVAACHLCAAAGLIRPQDSIFSAVPKESTSCFVLAKGCYKWFSFKRAQLDLGTLEGSSFLIMAQRLCSSQKTNGSRRKKQTTAGVFTVSSLLLISCALSRTKCFKHFTFHFPGCQISLPKFPCVSARQPSAPPTGGTVPLPLGPEKFGKRMLLHLQLPCADTGTQRLSIFQNPQEISPQQ